MIVVFLPRQSQIPFLWLRHYIHGQFISKYKIYTHTHTNSQIQTCTHTHKHTFIHKHVHIKYTHKRTCTNMHENCRHSLKWTVRFNLHSFLQVKVQWVHYLEDLLVPVKRKSSNSWKVWNSSASHALYTTAVYPSLVIHSCQAWHLQFMLFFSRNMKLKQFKYL